MTVIDVPLPGFENLEVLSAATVPVMGGDEARWIRLNVWTEHHRMWNGGPRDWHRCRCPWGASGDCERGDHQACTRIGNDRPLSGPDTYLTVSGDKRLFVSVWLADRVCRWTCSCSCGHRQPRRRATVGAQ